MKLSFAIRHVVLISAVAGAMSYCQTASAQAVPTATEAFNLRIRCKELADKKAENFYLGPPEAIKFVSWTSKYDAKNNRCYIGLAVNVSYPKIPLQQETRQIYDAATDDLLAFTEIKNGKKLGMVFDPEHRATTDANLGWDNAAAYIDEMMADKRR